MGTPGKLFEKASTYDVLFQALQYVMDDRKDDFVHDVIGDQDYLYNSKHHLEKIEDQLQTNNYFPSAPFFLDIPKRKLAVRPGSFLQITDRIVGYAIVTVLAPLLDRLLPENVYSYRLKKENTKQQLLEERHFLKRKFPILKTSERKEIDDFEEWYVQWPVFIDAAKFYLEKKKFKFLVQTDISAYFENINHSILLAIISEHSGDSRIINLLNRLLARWAWPNSSGMQIRRGIPQGNDVSSFLGNIYLLPIDQYLLKQRKGGRSDFVRYADDIWVFTKTYDEARRIQFGINRILRDLCLNMQMEKTEIYTEDRIRRLIHDDRIEKINSLIEEIEKLPLSKRSRFRSSEARQLDEKVSEVYKEISKRPELKGKNDIRLFKRILTALRMLKSTRGIRQCFRELKNNPAITTKIIGYLKSFPKGDLTANETLNFLQSPSNIYQWQEGQLISLFKYRSKLPQGLRLFLQRRIRSAKTEWHAKAATISTYSCITPNWSDLFLVSKHYWEFDHIFVRRAALTALCQLPRKSRNEFFKNISTDDDPAIVRLLRYFQELTSSYDLARKELKAFQKYSASDSAEYVIKNFYKLYLISDNENNVVRNELIKTIKIIERYWIPDWLRSKLRHLKAQFAVDR